MRIINNKNIDSRLLLDLYYPYMLNVINNCQIESIRFEKDCIHIIGFDDKIVDEMEYFDAAGHIPTLYEYKR